MHCLDYFESLIGRIVRKHSDQVSLIPINSFIFVKNLIPEFATLIKDQVGSSSQIVHKSAVEDDPQRRRPDISLAKKVLDWEPRVTLKQGLQKTIDYFRKELSRKHYSDGTGVHPNEYQVNHENYV